MASTVTSVKHNSSQLYLKQKQTNKQNKQKPKQQQQQKQHPKSFILHFLVWISLRALSSVL
jgi:macrodomain Ter protein organizer (MatP/YcbG family)